MQAGSGPDPIDPRWLFTPDRQIWTIDRETVLLLGAGRALLLQFAHPQITAGARASEAAGPPASPIVTQVVRDNSFRPHTRLSSQLA